MPSVLIGQSLCAKSMIANPLGMDTLEVDEIVDSRWSSERSGPRWSTVRVQLLPPLSANPGGTDGGSCLVEGIFLSPHTSPHA